MADNSKPTIVPVDDVVPPIPKPSGFDLNKFKSKRAASHSTNDCTLAVS